MWKLLEYKHVEQSRSFETFVWANEPDLRRKLREATGLEDEILEISSEWDQILRLMDWVHHLSQHQGWDEAPELSALQLLEDVRDGKVTFRCVEFAHMLQQVYSAFGIPSRVIGLRRPESDNGLGKAHVVVDAWSNEHQKWVVLDPQLNTAYADRKGLVLSAFELHDRVRSGAFDDIVMTQEAELRKEYSASSAGSKDNLLYETFDVPPGFERDEVWDSLQDDSSFEGFLRFWEEYYYQFVYTRSYSLLRLKSVSGSSGGKELFYHDPQELPPIVFQRMRKSCDYTSDRSKINFPVNGVEIQWIPAEVSEDADIQDTRKITLKLTHSMPWFQHYEVVVNGQPLLLDEDSLAISLLDGENHITITPVNDLGRKGSSSVVRMAIS